MYSQAVPPRFVSEVSERVAEASAEVSDCLRLAPDGATAALFRPPPLASGVTGPRFARPGLRLRSAGGRPELCSGMVAPRWARRRGCGAFPCREIGRASCRERGCQYV